MSPFEQARGDSRKEKLSFNDIVLLIWLHPRDQEKVVVLWLDSIKFCLGGKLPNLQWSKGYHLP